MNLKNFISKALSYPSDCIAYHVSRELAELFPEQAVVEGDDYDFDLPEFVRDRRCAIVSESAVHAQARTDWARSDRALREEFENAWLKVHWRGHLLDVLLISWSQGGDRSRHFWIVADDRSVAETFFREVCEWSLDVRGEILVFSRGGWEKSAALLDAIRAATFDSLVLPAGLLAELEQDLPRFFASRELYDRYRVPWKRGVLLIGPPGNGKTHAVKALVNRVGVPCLYVRTFNAKYSTVDENIRRVFERARKVAPCVVVLEDLDSLVDAKSRSVLLNELDGFAENTGVAVLATTNHPDRLDPALLDRPSRFDRKFTFELPGLDERRAFVVAWNASLDPDARLSEAGVGAIAGATEGYSFAYLKELLVSSLMAWIQTARPGTMDKTMLTQAASLREQMRAREATAESESDDDDDDDDDDE